MASSNPGEFHNPNGLLDASSSNSGREDKSSTSKITQNHIDCHTSDNALNLEFLKKLQDLLEEDTVSSQFVVENVLSATMQATGNLQLEKDALGKASNPTHKLHLNESQHLDQHRPFLEISSLTHLPPVHSYSNSALEFGSSALLPNPYHCSPALECGSLASSPDAHQYQTNPNSSRPTPSIVQSHQCNSPLNHELPTGSRSPQQCISTAETDVPAIFRNSQQQNTSFKPSIFESFKPNFPHNTFGGSPLQQSTQCSHLDLALLHPALPEKFQYYPQPNIAAVKRQGNHYEQARGFDQPLETASEAEFQIQRQAYSLGGNSSVGSLRSVAAPIPDDETEGGRSRAIIRTNCSVDAAEQNVWHTAMKSHGVYRPKGEIRYVEDGTMQWRERKGTRWCNAVKHEDIRRQLIAECAQQGEYTYPRAKGKDVDSDITAFHPDQKDWAFRERHLRPEILHQYESKEYRGPKYPVQIWLYNGKVVLDRINHPILDFQNMPKTISSMVEGGLQEAITRQDSRIGVKDFRVRMPSDPQKKGSMSMPTLSAISMRRSRFRWNAGYLSWTCREGSLDIKNFVDNLLPANCKEINSTRAFRDLKPSEVKRMRMKNRGKHLSRAGKRLLSPGAKAEAERAFIKSLRRAEEKEGLDVSENLASG